MDCGVRARHISVVYVWIRAPRHRATNLRISYRAFVTIMSCNTRRKQSAAATTGRIHNSTNNRFFMEHYSWKKRYCRRSELALGIFNPTVYDLVLWNLEGNNRKRGNVDWMKFRLEFKKIVPKIVFLTSLVAVAVLCRLKIRWYALLSAEANLIKK